MVNPMKPSLGNDSATIGARVREARLLRDLGSNELGRLAGMGGGEVSQIENGVRPRPGVFAIARLADALRVHLEWLVFGRGPRDLDAPLQEVKDRAPDPPVGTFLLRLGRTPGLQRWIEDHPESVTVSELLRGMAAYEATPPRTRSDGQPAAGWGAFFHDVLAGNLGLGDRRSVGDPAAAEMAQLGRRPRRNIIPKRAKL